MSKLLKVLLLGCVLTLAAAVPALAQVSVEGERFNKPSGVSVAGGKGYSGGKALRIFSEKAIATKQVTITEASKVLVRARAGQDDGSPTLTLRVDGVNSGTRRIDSRDLADYIGYGGITLQPGTYTIGLKAGDVKQGRNVFVDVVSFPAVEQPPPDTSAPVATLTSWPEGQSVDQPDGSSRYVVNSSTVEFGFEAHTNTSEGPLEPSATFECQIDSGGYMPCTSPKTYSDLFEGQHLFQVRAIDTAGNVGNPVGFNFWVDTTPPDTTPPQTKVYRIEHYPLPTSSNLRVYFASSEIGASFECAYTTPPWAFSACGGGVEDEEPWDLERYKDVNPCSGPQRIAVRSRDQAGNVDASPDYWSLTCGSGSYYISPGW